MKAKINVPVEFWQKLNIVVARQKQKGFSNIVT